MTNPTRADDRHAQVEALVKDARKRGNDTLDFYAHAAEIVAKIEAAPSSTIESKNQ